MKSEARIARIGEIITTISPPKKIKTGAYLNSGLYPVIDQSPEFISGWSNDVDALIIPPRGGVLIFGDHSCVIKFTDKPFVQGADGIKILKVIEPVLPHYLFAHLLAFPLPTDGYKRHFSDLKEHLITIPSVEVQKFISNLLSSIHDKIDSNFQLAKTLEQIAQTIFKSWFVDFEPVHANALGEQLIGIDAETSSLFPASFEDSELGEIPSGWKVQSADELFDMSIGRTPPRKEPEWFCNGSNGVPWVSIRDMGRFGVYSGSTNEGLTEEAVEKFKVPIVPANSVLMSFKLTVGKLCITDRPVVTNEAIAHFKPNHLKGISAEFAYLWLKQFDMESLDSTSSIATATNSRAIRNIAFLVPNDSAMSRFNDLMTPLFLAIKSLSHENHALIQVRDSLLPRLISGELEIPADLLEA